MSVKATTMVSIRPSRTIVLELGETRVLGGVAAIVVVVAHAGSLSCAVTVRGPTGGTGRPPTDSVEW